MDWLDAIGQLPARSVLVEHEPPTDRYGRALQKLRYLGKRSELVGTKKVNPTVVEIAVWAPSNSGGRSGYYACFRVTHKDGQPLTAVLFCFYDGTDASPSVPSAAAATAIARSEGFFEGE